MPEVYTKEEIEIINAKQLLTVKEAAVSMGVHARTIYRLIESGRLPICKIGNRCIRIRRQEYERFIVHNLKGGEKVTQSS